jgi:hypothetical protein
MSIVITVKRDAQLKQVILARAASGPFARRLHCRQHERNQYSDNRDTNEHFDERECATTSVAPALIHCKKILVIEFEY